MPDGRGMTRLTTAALAALVLLALPGSASAANCGDVSGGLGTTASGIHASGVACSVARRVARGYLPGGQRPAGWSYSYRGYVITARKNGARVRFALAGTD
jgi:hypothetical protein